MTDFATQLQYFRGYAWNLHPDFGRSVDAIIEQNMGRDVTGFGDADPFATPVASDQFSVALQPTPGANFAVPQVTGITPIPKSSVFSPSGFFDPMALQSTNTPGVNPSTAQNITTGIDQLVNTTAASYLNAMGAYYGTQAQVAKLQAAANPQYQIPQQYQQSSQGTAILQNLPILLAGGVAILGLVLIMSKGDGSSRRFK